MNKKLNQVLAVVLTIVALMTGQTAIAETTWTVQVTSHDDNSNVTTFTITRSEKTYAKTVLYRTVGLSAYDGQHFTATSGSISFGVNEDSKTVTVTENVFTTTAYWFQSTGTNRSYKLEVTDGGGYLLASCSRDVATGSGTQLSTAYLNTGIVGMTYFDHGSNGSLLSGTMALGSSPAIKYLDVAHSGSAGTWVKVTDGGYSQAVHTISTDALYSSSVQRTFLNNQGTKMYATVYFTQIEEEDGYQYIQIYSSNYDSADDPDGGVDDPVNALYKACFILSYTPSGSVMTNPHTQFFPHRWDYEDRVSQFSGNSWNWQEFDDDNAHLYAQKFKASSLRAENSGSLVLSPTVNNLNVRFDAAGSGGDNWWFKDLKVRLALCDATAPTVLARSVAPGRHARGNTLYLSVAFSEPVTITGSTKKLATNWGDLSYLSGSGTNVLTFSGTIQDSATGTLSITGSDGAIADLAGNYLSGSVNADGLCTLDVNDLSLLSQDGSGHYLIASTGDLHILSAYVNDGHDCSGLTFLQTADITYSHSTGWEDANSTENNFTRIGYEDHPFKGTFDGQNYTISGIRIYKGGDGWSDRYQGLFGNVNSGTVKHVNLSDARITGFHDVGGIAGHTFSCTIEECTVGADVCIHAVQSSASYHGGIVGLNQANYVRRCISRARLTVANASGCKEYGGIAGFNDGQIINCIADGVVIPDVKGRGAIVGYMSNGSLNRNYYYNCKVASNSVTPSGVGKGDSESSTTTNDVSNNQGALAIYALDLSANVTVTRYASTTLPGSGNKTYTTGADIAGSPYYISGATVNLSHSDREGYTFVDYSSSDATINGSSFTMPANDVTVTTTWTPADIINVTANKPAARSDYWATFYHPEANYAITDGITIYKGKIGSGNVELTDATGNSIIPAGQAVVLNYSDANITSPITLTKTMTEATGDYTGNDLKGGATVTDGYMAYTLANGSHGVGFYKYNGSGLSPIKAHLEIATPSPSSPAPAFFGFGGSGENTTAINEHESHQSHEFTGDYYTLDGRKLQGKPTQKGIYVRKGRKIIIK